MCFHKLLLTIAVALPQLECVRSHRLADLGMNTLPALASYQPSQTSRCRMGDSTPEHAMYEVKVIRSLCA